MTDVTKHFRLVGIVPGLIDHGKMGRLDLRNLTEAQALQLHQERWPYIRLTDAGRAHYYPQPKVKKKQPRPKPRAKAAEKKRAAATKQQKDE